MKSLEERISHLERELACASQVSPPAGANSTDAVETPQATAASLVPLGAVHTALVPSETSDDRTGTEPYRTLLEGAPPPSNVIIPPLAGAQQLAAAYFEHSDFFSPILDRAVFMHRLSELYRDDAGEEDSAPRLKFTVLMVLAVAVRLLNRTDASLPTTNSETFSTTADALLSKYPEAFWTWDIEHLEVLLLLVQYSMFAPRLRSAWHCIGMASRLAIDLGLHTTLGESVLGQQAAVLEHRRRRLFWTLYSYERNLCVVLDRPFSIPDQVISTPLPEHVQDRSVEKVANHIIFYRRLESELYQTLVAGQSDTDFLDWRDRMRRRILTWRDTAPTLPRSTKLAPVELFRGLALVALIRLYSGGKGVQTLATPDTIFLAECAVENIYLYKRCFVEGKLRFYWRTTPNLFRSGAALVQCVQQLSERNESVDHLQRMRAAVTVCTNVLWAMAERYPPGRPLRDEFDQLATAVSAPPSSTFAMPAESSPTEHADFGSFSDMLSDEAFIDQVFDW